MKYLFDTNVVVAIQKDNLRVLERVRASNSGDIVLSSIIMHELYFGAFKSDRIERNLAEIAKLRFPVLDFDHEDARIAEEVRHRLRRLGTPIGP